MPMALFIQALHQDHDRPFVIVTDRGKPAGVARQQHQRRLPGFKHVLFKAGKPEQHYAINVAALKHTEMLLHHLRRELALHHDRIVALLVERGQHRLYGEVFGEGIQTRDNNGDHFIALPAHGARGAGRGKTVLIHHRLDALACALADTAFVVKHA